MPYTSDQQRKWAHTPTGMAKLGGPKKVAEWDQASKGLKLPKIAGMRAHGGRTGDGAYLVGEKGPEIFVPRHKGAIVPNKEVKRLGEKYAKRQGGGPVQPKPDTPQAGFRPGGKQVEGLQRRAIISNKAKEKRLGKWGRGASHSRELTETTPIDAATR